MDTVTFNPRAAFVAAVREIMDAMPREKPDICPFCECEPGWLHQESCPLHRLGVLMERYAFHFPEDVQPRREQTLAIDRRMLEILLRMGNPPVVSYVEGFPEGARIAGVDREIADDFFTDNPIRLIIESAAFEPVLPHERPAMRDVVWYLRQAEPGEIAAKGGA
jgi:hypothetical protein